MNPLLNYLLEWTVSLAVLLGVYRLVLENQAMHPLKRAYLLGALLLPLVIPFLAIEVPPGTLPYPTPVEAAPPAPTKAAEEPAVIRLAEAGARQSATARQRTGTPLDEIIPSVTTAAGGLYGAIVLLMLVRLVRNLYRLHRQVRTHPTQPFGKATLVRLPGEALPYTFLHYLFVSDAAYRRGDVEPELMTHELTHIRQRHSVDVLLVEIVLCFGWFNPLLFWLKRAIQLNHEFLADQSVNTTHRNVASYQRLLLSKLIPNTLPLALTSTLTFQTTKQRLLMMTRQSSPARRLLAAGSTLLLFGTLTVVLTARTVAQQVPAVTQPKAKPADTAPPLGRKLTPEEMDRWFADKKVDVFEERKTRQVRYGDLTPDQKKRVSYIVTEPRKQPTEAQWNDWQNTKKYGLWIDEKRRRDNPLATKVKRTDIVYFWSSYVYKNARQPEGYTYQLELYTEGGYQKLLKENLTNPSLLLREKKTAAVAPAPAPGVGQALPADEIERRFGDTKVEVWENGKPQQIQYRDLTPAQKKWVSYVPFAPAVEPSPAQWNDWQNTKKYGLWIDGKRRRDTPLGTQYKRTDIFDYSSGYVHKNARQPEGYSHELHLYTKAGYEQRLKQHDENPFVVLREDKPAPKQTGR